MKNVFLCHLNRSSFCNDIYIFILTFYAYRKYGLTWNTMSIANNYNTYIALYLEKQRQLDNEICSGNTI